MNLIQEPSTEAGEVSTADSALASSTGDLDLVARPKGFAIYPLSNDDFILHMMISYYNCSIVVVCKE